MLFALPDHDSLYQALLDQDQRFEGRVFVGVTTTGIFCRLTCPARKPNSENCRFFEVVSDCIEAGFRPCKRCRPLSVATESDPSVAKLLQALERRPGYRWSEPDIAAMGLDPSTVRRNFKRQFGMTFLQMARHSRIRDGFEVLSEGGSVIDAQLQTGFESASAFREAFARLLGQPPALFAVDAELRADWLDTPLGAMIAVSDEQALHLLEFADRKALPAELGRLRRSAGPIGLGRPAPIDQLAKELDVYFKGRSDCFTVPMLMHASGFRRRVWDALLEIPAGETRSYGDIAKAIGQPTATRAVARANGANQIAILIPCHRVIGADGSLTGYGGGLWRKQRLIETERQYQIARPD